MGRKHLSQTWLAVVLFMLAAMKPSYTAQLEKPEVNIAIGGNLAQLYFLPVLLADRLGYFSKEGLNVHMVDTGSGAKGLQALVGGSADVTAGSFEHPLQLQARGQDIVAFVKYGRFHGNVLGIVPRHVGDYKSPASMKGWSVGISSPGSSSYIFATLLLAKNGLKPSDVSFIAVGQGTRGVAAVRNGKELDAVSLTDPTISELESTGDIVVVADSRSLKGTIEAYGGETISGVLYSTREYQRNNPNTVQAMTNAIVRTLYWIKSASIEDIIAKVPESYIAGKPDLYKTVLKKNIENYQSDGTFANEPAELTVKFLRESADEFKNSKLDPGKAYDNAFAKRANEIIAGK
jgi:NitT/TauT family transport system substrate-binding protein